MATKWKSSDAWNNSRKDDAKIGSNAKKSLPSVWANTVLDAKKRARNDKGQFVDRRPKIHNWNKNKVNGWAIVKRNKKKPTWHESMNSFQGDEVDGGWLSLTPGVKRYWIGSAHVN